MTCARSNSRDRERLEYDDVAPCACLRGKAEAVPAMPQHANVAPESRIECRHVDPGGLNLIAGRAPGILEERPAARAPDPEEGLRQEG